MCTQKKRDIFKRCYDKEFEATCRCRLVEANKKVKARCAIERVVVRGDVRTTCPFESVGGVLCKTTICANSDRNRIETKLIECPAQKPSARTSWCQSCNDTFANASATSVTRDFARRV